MARIQWRIVDLYPSPGNTDCACKGNTGTLGTSSMDVELGSGVIDLDANVCVDLVRFLLAPFNQV